MVNRTKRLTMDRALKILQLRYGTQVRTVTKSDDTYVADSILGDNRTFSRQDILNVEDEMFSRFGC